MQNKIILASKSKVRKEILDKNNIENSVEHSNVDEDTIKSISYENKLNHNNRNKIISLQTPQGFDLNQIFKLHYENRKYFSSY